MSEGSGREAPSPLDACAQLAADHYENFPVQSPLLPQSERDDLAVVYAYCRTTDDLGDELAGDRLAALDAWDAATRSAIAGAPAKGVPLLLALADTVRRREIPEDLFARLIESNRIDQRVSRYPDTPALLDYCEHSATPVGRMVLRVFGFDDEARGVLSDATCIGLQLANFWQDLARDWSQGRCYLPLDACSAHGVDPEVELGRRSASRALRGLVAEQVASTREWFHRGWPLGRRLPIRQRALVRAFSRGGWAILDAIEALDYNTLAVRPTVSRRARRGVLAHEILRAPLRGARLPARGPAQ